MKKTIRLMRVSAPVLAPILALGLALGLALNLTACNQTPSSTGSGGAALTPVPTEITAAPTPTPTTADPTPTLTPTPAATPTPEPTPTPTAAPTPEPSGNALPQAAAGVNTLTGLPLADASRQNLRPVAIMINNIKVATPQLGINAADLYYEMEVEGGITRMLVVFADPATVPEIGSIRSARHDYIDLAGGHDAIYVHAGGSYAAYDQLARQKTDDLDMASDAEAFWRDPTWARARGKEHSVRTTGSRIVAAIASNKFRTTFKSTPLSAFRFLDSPAPAADPAASPAGTVNVTFSNYTTSTFRYNAETKLYSKYQFGGPQTDLADGKPLQVTNVLVLRTRISSFEGTILRDANLTSGSGYYISQGARKVIKWQKGDTYKPIILMNEDGTPLQINRGKTFICIQDTSEKITFQ